MKPEKLSNKALLLMANMHGMSRCVSSADLAFLAPQTNGAREWALSALKRLQLIGFMENGPRINNAQSFMMTDAGRAALHAQLPTADVEPADTLYEYDGPQLFVAEILGATRLVMTMDSHGGTYLVSTPTPALLNDVVESRVKVVEGMVSEPCFFIDNLDGTTYTLSEKTGSAEIFREFCGASTYLDPKAFELEVEAEAV